MRNSFLSIFLILIFGSIWKAQIVNVSNCTELQNLQTNNITVVYNITQNLFCAPINFTTIGNISHVFRGVIEGNYYSINDLTINSSSNYVALFAFGQNCIVRNLNLRNLKIDTINKTAGGAFIANCTNCKINKFFSFTQKKFPFYSTKKKAINQFDFICCKNKFFLSIIFMEIKIWSYQKIRLIK